MLRSKNARKMIMVFFIVFGIVLLMGWLGRAILDFWLRSLPCCSSSPVRPYDLFLSPGACASLLLFFDKGRTKIPPATSVGMSLRNGQSEKDEERVAARCCSSVRKRNPSFVAKTKAHELLAASSGGSLSLFVRGTSHCTRSRRRLERTRKISVRQYGSSSQRVPSLSSLAICLRQTCVWNMRNLPQSV